VRPLAVGDSKGAEEAQIHGRHIEIVSAKLSRHLCRMMNSRVLRRDYMNHQGRENLTCYIITCLSLAPCDEIVSTLLTDGCL
jgi:hypothetical protein